MIEQHLPEITLAISTLSGLLGLGAWMVSQLNAVRDHASTDVSEIYRKITDVERILDTRIDNTNEKVIDSNKQLAIIQETLHGLSCQIGNFTEVTKSMLAAVVDNSKQIGKVDARCEAIQNSKRQQ